MGELSTSVRRGGGADFTGLDNVRITENMLRKVKGQVFEMITKISQLTLCDKFEPAAVLLAGVP